MPRNPHFHLDSEKDCLQHPEEDLATGSIGQYYVCRLPKGHEGDHVFVPVEMVIYDWVPDQPAYARRTG
ncbi:hypothetical protein RXV95_02925 [Novosphingobium sp. ZN18A2]|uniref:hypothetical protein n=1 Tax=Novosphingobium sp. ZN18A2 TaxID=3079861 RepID=UPI0030D51918